MKNNKKAQTAIEFIMLVGFVFFAFTVFILAVQTSTSDKIKEEQTLRVKEVVIDVQDEINLAYQSSNGYYREFSIPEKINGISYEINIIEGLVYLKTDNGKNAIALSVQNVTGDLVKGINNITKQGGVVELNK